MKILIISGTPKQDGICDSLVKTALAAANESGVEPEAIKLAEYNLPHCKMCGDGWGICFGKHECEFGGDFNMLQEKCREADAFIYITPVYWSEVSETLKLFLDKLRRCQATKQWNKDDKSGGSFIAGKPSILVANAGGGGGGIINTLDQMERAIAHMGGNSQPRGNRGVYDYIAVNRWNQEYKRESLKAAVKSMIKSLEN
jgi:multimeric flavodoxin WrbA